MTRPCPDTDVEVITAAEVRQAVDRSLRDLGVTFEQLAAQARAGRWQSERARLVWMAIADLGLQPSDPLQPSGPLQGEVEEPR